MPELLKNIYNPSFFEQFTGALNEILPDFKKQHFLNKIFDINWEKKELKQRMQHIAATLKDHLPGNFKENISCILKIIQQLQKDGVKEGSLEYMFFPEFIAQFGLEDLKTSLKAMETVTQFTSCEFAIRPFLIKYPAKVMEQMQKWSTHKSHFVRRFSSEGCRPRLPWVMAIPGLKKNPSPILPILENLKNDESLFVRKSVANNLNDIAKDNPGIVAALAKKWKGKNAATDWIVKLGCRTLLKKADKNIYKIFGLNAVSNCEVNGLKLGARKIKIGDKLNFSFQLRATNAQTTKLRIEYVVYYIKATGKQTKKIFKLSENNFLPNQTYSFTRHQRFQDFTTRKHYPGKHKIGIVVNGQELAFKEFMLTK